MRHWRWAVVFGGVAALISIPVVSANWPVDQPDIALDQLQQRIAASATTPFSGLFESRGGLRLPDLGRYEDEVTPFKTSSRVRVWYAAPDSWRADELLIGAERGTYREPGGLWRWDSGTRRVVHSPRADVEPSRIPRLMDLSPAEAGRRLLAQAATDDVVTQIPAERVAGHVAAGLRITSSSTTTTIRSIEMWADVDTGVVLKVQIDTGDTAPVFDSAFVDFHLGTPSADVVTFDPTETDQPVRESATVDVIEALSQTEVIPFPDELAGLPRRGSDTGGLATYGTGYSSVTVIAVPRGSLGRPGRGIYAVAPTDRPWGGQAVVLSTSLFNMEIVSSTLLDVIVAGTVTVAELDRISGQVSDGAIFG